MRSVRGSWLPALAGRSAIAALCLTSASLSAQTLAPVHQQRYCMGTMFDVVVYHESRSEAERAIEQALNEVVRLDRVMSHFKADSDLARLVRNGRGEYVSVDPSLYEVIEQSLGYSRRSGGKFDVTIAPILKVWKQAYAEGRRPTAEELTDGEALRRLRQDRDGRTESDSAAL